MHGRVDFLAGLFGVCCLGVGFVTYDGYDTTLAAFLIEIWGADEKGVLDDSFIFDITIINTVCLTFLRF